MKGQAVLLGIVTVVVACAVVAGFLVMGSPQDARKVELDKRRVEDLKMLASIMSPGYGRTPIDSLFLESLGDRAPSKMRDPLTREPYGYHVVDSTHFEVCATFDTEVKPEDLDSWEKGWSHPKGRHCFRFRVGAPSLPEPGGR